MRSLGQKPNTELLLPDGGGWNVGKLNELFFERDVEDIVKIPVGRAGSEDYLLGTTPKTGYSVSNRRII